MKIVVTVAGLATAATMLAACSSSGGGTPAAGSSPAGGSVASTSMSGGASSMTSSAAGSSAALSSAPVSSSGSAVAAGGPICGDIKNFVTATAAFARIVNGGAGASKIPFSTLKTKYAQIAGLVQKISADAPADLKSDASALAKDFSDLSRIASHASSIAQVQQALNSPKYKSEGAAVATLSTKLFTWSQQHCS